ncbi:MAG: hypothetical protein ACUVQ7_06745, partial [bacterium]
MSASRISLVTAIALGLCACLSCLREDIVRPDRNRPPETVLTVGPNMGSEVDHKYLVRWTGFDCDGIVVGYFIALVSERQLYGGFTSESDKALYIATLDWHHTTSTESLFVLRADNPTSREYSLYVMAVDNEGKLDPTPAAVNFTAVNYLRPDPIIEISTSIDTVPRIPPPRGDTIPAYHPGDYPYEPIKIFVNWKGEDPDGEILSWKFSIDASPWEMFPADKTSKIFTYYPDNKYGKSDVYLGTHEVRIQALDDAYSFSPDKPKSALFVINYDPESIIDSVWSFRLRDARDTTDTIGPILIYPYDGEDYPVAYQFGQLIIKFHAVDRDNHPDSIPPRWFKWEIAGTGIKSGGTDGWVSKFADSSGGAYYYIDTTAFYNDRLYYDWTVFRLLLRARDHQGKIEATAAQFKFMVNFPPRITALRDSVTKVIGDSIANVNFSWDVEDSDEGYGFTAKVQEFDY